MARASAKSPRNRAAKPLPFARKLVLSQWLLGRFGVERFEQLAEHLRNGKLEGLDGNNKKAMLQRHIVFQEEDAATHIRTMLPR